MYIVIVVVVVVVVLPLSIMLRCRCIVDIDSIVDAGYRVTGISKIATPTTPTNS